MSNSDWERAIQFHGHTCPGLAMGYRAAKIGLRELKEARAEDEELVAIVETDACGVDAIQLLTGCTLGKGNLIYRDYGKQVFTFIGRNSGQAVRVAMRAESWQPDAAMQELRARVFSGRADEREAALFRERQQALTEYILAAPEDAVCRVQRVQVELPPKARLFNSVTCAACGEAVAEVRARIRGGQPVCIPCSEKYSRGWGSDG